MPSKHVKAEHWIAAQWEKGFRFLKRYRQDKGHCLVPERYRDQVSGYWLGMWVSRQRRGKDIMLPKRRAQLEALGFVWDSWEAQWEEGFRFLKRYRQDKGDCLVPSRYRDRNSGFRLGRWVTRQRQDGAKDTMLPKRRARLEALGFAWNVL